MNTVKKFDEFIEDKKMNVVISDNHLDYEMDHEVAYMNTRDNDKKGFPNSDFDIEIWDKEGNKEPHIHVIHKKDGYDVRIRISDGTVLSVESYGNKGRTHTFSELEPLAKYWLNDETNDVVFTGSNQLICYGEYFIMNPDSPYLKYWDKINKQLKEGNDYVDNNKLDIYMDKTNTFKEFVEQMKKDVISGEMLDKFDINSIPMPVLDKTWVDYDLLVDEIDYFKIDENGVYDETLYEPTSLEDVTVRSVSDIIQYLERLMDLSYIVLLRKKQNQFGYIASEELLATLPDWYSMPITMLISDYEDNVDIVIEKMAERGYKLVNKSIKKDAKGRKWVLMAFDPLRQETIREQVLKYHTYGYHATPSYHADSIEEKGINAKTSEQPLNTHTELVYLYVGLSTKMDDYIMVMKSMSDNLKKANNQFTGDFVEYEIELDKLPDDMKFYYATHGLGKDFVYVEGNIPVEAIRDREYKTF